MTTIVRHLSILVKCYGDSIGSCTHGFSSAGFVFLTENQVVLVFCSAFIQVCDIKLCHVDNLTLLNCSYPRHWLRELRSHLACIHSFCMANVSLEYV